MNLEGIKGHYDSIFSLGELCLNSLQLKDNNLRTFSGILDWVSSPSLKNVNVLIYMRLNKFIL